MELSLFEEVGEAVRGLVPAELGELRLRSHRWGVKAWFGGARPTREHYEAQVIGAEGVPGATVLALEVGFHAEHPRPADNDEVIARLVGAESSWRRILGGEPQVGAFIGRQEHWRRVSETWPDPNLDEPDLGLELAGRLTDYITALEPARRR